MDLDELLTANESFYQAFREKDFRAMDALWATKTPVVCLHPGWGPLIGRDIVMESWRGILDQVEMPPIFCAEPVGVIIADTGYVICFESVAQTSLVATNLFVREEGVWKMYHHHSGPTAAAPPDNFEAVRSLH